ncbi:unnamed protein product [Parascedosporium putredinis]|uniref:Sulfotransferase family protein n=1 Tax=Parascedosporium putredinis TaxID=1442378 RepID=A0A9P1HCH6_9PEZI|nr:unnamed protein product [Parascedosporium putredinis]CAI8003865.1 unnamed protein product [Parascedosporium putredinis]
MASVKPIFTATHPRACSTAFERVFMTRRDSLECVHEPFGEPFYYGPERMSERWMNDNEYRLKSGYANTTYKDVLDTILKVADEHTFLLPLHRSPLDSITNFDHFLPNEAGYDELRRLFDYLISEGVVDRDSLVVLDADDMLDNPEAAIRAYCEKVGIDFRSDMLNWSQDDATHASEAFEKWNGFHNDAIKSSSLRPRSHAQKSCTSESEDEEWKQKYGEDAQRVIRKTVEDNIADYEYLKQFALKIPARTN